MASVSRSDCTVGLDDSEAHLARARKRSAPGVRYARHDVTTLPFPDGLGNLVDARFVPATCANR
jgi:ubiquinone/menaquinone biosynthesis C-methylase UbiE